MQSRMGSVFKNRRFTIDKQVLFSYNDLST